MWKEWDCAEDVLCSRECDFRSTPNEESDVVLVLRCGAVGRAEDRVGLEG